MVYKEDKTWS